MNSKSNGKLIAGLIIMFVVAVSVIGVTYAYFVSTFTPNQNPESVKITAGKLIATYDAGVSMNARNVVPGWLSDGLHYYDVDVAAANKGRIYATKATAEKVAADTESGTGYARPAFGIAAPITFTVTNNSDSEDTDSTADGVQSPVSYIIRLKVVANGILNAKAEATTAGNTALANTYDADSKNMLVSLYRGNFDADAANFGGEKISGPFVVGAKDDIQLATPVQETINKVGDSTSYFVIFEYINDKCGVQPSQGINMNVEAIIAGVQKDNTTNTWYDEDNVAIDFETVPTAVTSDYLKTCNVDGTTVTNESALIPAAAVTP